jgi:hypothetical protein
VRAAAAADEAWRLIDPRAESAEHGTLSAGRSKAPRMQQSHCRLAILASVLLLAGMSRCEMIHSDVRLLTDGTRIDVSELDGAFLYEGEIPFEITRLGHGQYEYAGLSYRLPDPDLVAAEVLEDLTATFEALDLPEDPNAAPPPMLEAQREDEAICPWVGRGDRQCALKLAELLEPDYPGILAFEQALAELPSRLFRQRVRFSLHDLGQGRLAAQQEEAAVPALQQYAEVEARWTELNATYYIYSWAELLSDLTLDSAHPNNQIMYFETEMGKSVSAVALLRRLDDGVFAVVPIAACTRPDHLAAYGFERQENGSSRDPFVVRPIADGTDTDFVGMLKACFPEDLTGDFRFWKVGVEPPPLPAAGEE